MYISRNLPIFAMPFGNSIGHNVKPIFSEGTNNMMAKTSFAVEFVNANYISAVNNLSANLKKGASVQVVSYKETKMNKGTKNNRNPFLGRVMERTTIGGWVVGTNYNRSCQNATERSGSNSEFNGKGSWHTYYNDFFEVSKNDSNKFYLQLQKSAKTGTTSTKTYYVDGIEASEEQVEEIKAWLPTKTHKQSSSQVESGIDAEHERMYMCVGLENIESITQGAFSYRLKKVESLAVAESK